MLLCMFQVTYRCCRLMSTVFSYPKLIVNISSDVSFSPYVKKSSLGFYMLFYSDIGTGIRLELLKILLII